jgi:hypothetical protein
VENYQAVAERLSAVTGFLKPVMQDDPIPGREPRWGLTKEDFEQVVAGYACPKCRATWNDGLRLTCPACQHKRSAADFLDGVKEWDDYQRYREDAIANPQSTEVPGMDTMVDGISEEALDGWLPGVKRNL